MIALALVIAAVAALIGVIHDDVFVVASVCTGGAITYTYMALTNCTSFSGVTSQTTVLITGAVTDFDAISQCNFGTWPGSFTITGTSIIEIANLRLTNVGSLTITDNPQLSSINLDLVGAGTLTITSNVMLSSVSLPMLTGPMARVMIANGALTNMTMMGPINQDITFVTIIEPHLTTLVGLSGLRWFDTFVLDAGSLAQMTPLTDAISPNAMTLSHLPVSNLAFLNLHTVSTLTLANLTSLISLNGLQTLTSATSLSIIGADMLTDWSALISIPSGAITSLTVTGSCCPSYSIFGSTTGWTRADFDGCIECFEVTAVSSQYSPITGGVTVVLSYTGAISEHTITVQSASSGSSTNCTVMQVITCVTPSIPPGLPGPHPIVVITSGGIAVTTAFNMTYVSVEEYRGNSTLVTSSSSSPISGLIIDRTTYVNYITEVVLIVIGCVSGGYLVIYLLAISRSRNARHCFRRLDIFHTNRPITTSDSKQAHIQQRTSFGGAITLLIIVVAIPLFSLLILQNVVNNLSSNVSLQPRQMGVATRYVGSVTWYGFNQPCNRIMTTTQGFTGNVTIAGDDGTTPHDCTATITCDDRISSETLCTFSGSSPSWQIWYDDPNIFATGFAWSFTTWDALSLESTASGILSPTSSSDGNDTSVFKGAPSEVSLTLTISNYTTLDDVMTSGVVTSVEGQIVGGITTNWPPASGTGLIIWITPSSSMMITTITAKQSLLSQLLLGLSIVSSLFFVGRVIVAIRHCVGRHRSRQTSVQLSASKQESLPI